MAKYTFKQEDKKIVVRLISNVKDVAWYVHIDGSFKNVFGCQTVKPSKKVIKQALLTFK